MSLLLDTQIIVWFATDPQRLSKAVRERLSGTSEPLYVSFVSGWEYGIKRRYRPHELPLPFDSLLMSGYRRLGIDFDLFRYSESLPNIHRDPFDRMLVAQALALNLILVTSDAVIHKYPVPTFW